MAPSNAFASPASVSSECSAKVCKVNHRLQLQLPRLLESTTVASTRALACPHISVREFSNHAAIFMHIQEYQPEPPILTGASVDVRASAVSLWHTAQDSRQGKSSSAPGSA